MSQKPENTFIKSIHTKMAKEKPYFEKTNNPWRAGTPDVYYSGDKSELWIEYKYIPKIPISSEILPDLTPRQRRWLNERYDEGRNVFVVLGTPDGGVIYRDKEWLKPLSSTEIEAKLLSRAEIARWIISEAGVSRCHSSASF